MLQWEINIDKDADLFRFASRWTDVCEVSFLLRRCSASPSLFQLEKGIDVPLLALWRTIKRGDSLASLCLTALQFLRFFCVSFFHSFYHPSCDILGRRSLCLSITVIITRHAPWNFHFARFFFVRANEQSVYSVLFSFRFYNKCRQLDFISFTNFTASQIRLYDSEL